VAVGVGAAAVGMEPITRDAADTTPTDLATKTCAVSGLLKGTGLLPRRCCAPFAAPM
jgi:hypothetical protein